MSRYLLTGARWTDFSSPSQFAFLTAKQGVAVSPLDKREVGLWVNWKFYVLALWLMDILPTPALKVLVGSSSR